MIRHTTDEVSVVPTFVLDEGALQALVASQLFAHVPRDRLARVAWRETVYSRGDVILRQGKRPAAVGLIMDGRASLGHCQDKVHPRDTR
jgi:hypothetical protein